MKHSSQHTFTELKAFAEKHFIRQPVVVFGDLLSEFSTCQRDTEICLVSNQKLNDHVISWRACRTILGQELGGIFLDCSQGVEPEALCAIAGAIKGGHLLVIYLGEHEEKFLQQGKFERRLARYLAPFYWDRVIASISSLERKIPAHEPFVLPTDGQKQIMLAIEKVMTGHRRRPLIIVSDRGRGKSSSLGLAAGNILKKNKKKILVTAPSIVNTGELFHHAQQSSGGKMADKYRLTCDHGSELHFISPDRLLEEKHDCDLVMVDEAAAIPLPMLTSMLHQYSRLVFASTEHGYEGSGRSFTLRFTDLLDHVSKGWKLKKLLQPIRYSSSDPLESWLFQAFLFDVEPVIPALNGHISYRVITSQDLFDDENLLRQCFSLLVSAHYQTSPNELKHLLNDDSQIMTAAFCDDVLIGIAIGKIEGGFSAEIAEKVVAGERRLKGHLLAQSLAAHLGLVNILENTLVRIVRVAILPVFRRQNIATQLIQQQEKQAFQLGIGLIGVSFGTTEALLSFWKSLSFLPFRMGVTKDMASGAFSLQMLKPLKDIPQWFESVQHNFSENFVYQLPEQFQSLDPHLVLALLTQGEQYRVCSEIERTQVMQFAHGTLGYDLIPHSLQKWLLYCVGKYSEQVKMHPNSALMVSRVLQRQSWLWTAKQYGQAGRKQIEKLMKQWVKESFHFN